METRTTENLLSRIEDLEHRLAEAEQLIEAIKAGEVDAFALNTNNQPEIFTLQSGDYAYRVLVENFSEGALNLSEDGLIVYSNKSFHETLNITYENVIGKSIFQFIHPESKEVFNQLFNNGLSGQSKGDISLIAGNKTFPVHVSLTSLHPMLPTIGMIVTDLSEKKEQERNLKQSEEKFNKLFAASPLGLVLSEIPSGKIVDANQVYLETTGYSREESIGKTSLDLKLVDKDARQKILDVLNKTGSIRNVEVEITTKKGDKIPVLNSVEKISIGDTEYYISAIIDIVDRKMNERKIEEKNTALYKINKELEAFTYVSSHDLQEPLRKIQTFAGIIVDEQHNLSSTSRHYFNRISAAALRMQTLIQDLLSFSRLTSTEHQFETADLNKIVDDVKTEFKETIESKNATIEVGELCSARIIPFQFRQLLYNLISNSLKFSKANVPPHIQIRSEIIPSYHPFGGRDVCHITVSDNGIGFEQHYSEKIFEVFQKLHSKDRYPGAGIGLAIVKKVIENHDGLITATGELDKGATFDIYIPARTDEIPG